MTSLGFRRKVQLWKRVIYKWIFPIDSSLKKLAPEGEVYQYQRIRMFQSKGGYPALNIPKDVGIWQPVDKDLALAMCWDGPGLCQGDWLPRASIKATVRPELRIRSQEQRGMRWRYVPEMSCWNSSYGTSPAEWRKSVSKRTNAWMNASPLGHSAICVFISQEACVELFAILWEL